MNEKEKADIQHVYRVNYPWYSAVLLCARIILSRTPKYAADRHPYFAIAKLANDTMRTMEETLLQFISLKYNRIMGSSQDFNDESLVDTVADLANYSLLLLGAMLEKVDIEDVLPEEEKQFGAIGDRVLIDVEHLMELTSQVDLESSEWFPREGAVDFLRDLSKAGRKIIVFAAVQDDTLPKIIRWLNENDMYRFVKTVTNRKVPTFIYCPRFAKQADKLDQVFDHIIVGQKRLQERIENEES